MNPLFFTLCSNNYLAQAKTLGDSVLKFYPESSFVIGLVDYRDDQIDYSFFKGMEILPFDELYFPEFEDMFSRYNVIEFNTAVKPFYIDYLWRTYGADHQIIYLDPDIVLYRPLYHVTEALKTHSVVLTPMFCEAPAETSLDELVALRHGMFNLGFIALRHSHESNRLIQWWKARLRTHCLIDKPRGIFVDQKWMDLAPLLFDEVFMLKHRGYNMAWWNFAERKLLDSGSDYSVNRPDQLLYFFHFSGFKPGSEYITGRSGESQFAYAIRPELQRLGQEYQALLEQNRFDFFSGLKPKLVFYSPIVTWKSKIKNRIKRMIKKLV
ncbi:MAG: glycosyl transferase [Bacteroidota bacterium]